jgi:hypothetical protein
MAHGIIYLPPTYPKRRLPIVFFGYTKFCYLTAKNWDSPQKWWGYL